MKTDQDLLAFAVELAREAGAIITDYFYRADRPGVERKSDGTSVTKADKQINQLVIDRLRAKYPDHGVLGEEQSLHADRRELWVCDPIDGTRGFILGVPTAMFSLAYVVDGVPQAAVIYNPVQDLLLSAVRGGGAFCNGERIYVSNQATLNRATIGANSSYRSILGRRQAYDHLVEQHADMLMVPGNIFQSSLVARGRADGYLFPGRSAHDVAATALIVTEAGGKVTDVDGNDQRYDGAIRGAIVSNGHIHDVLVETVATMGSERFLGY